MPSPDAILLDHTTESRLGFPPPLLGPEPVRLAVCQPGEALLAIALPGGLLAEAHPFYAEMPSVIAGLQAQLRAEKPELLRLGMTVALTVNFIEPDVSGLLLVGTTREGVERWRNAYGSQQLTFTFELVTRSKPELADELICELPIARHNYWRKPEPRMLVSHKTGKKSRTVFQRQKNVGAFDFWTATTTLPRLHQIRLHAMELGLEIPGEKLYGDHEPLTWSALREKSARGETGVILDQLPIHLAQIAPTEALTGFTAVRTATEGKMARLWREMDMK